MTDQAGHRIVVQPDGLYLTAGAGANLLEALLLDGIMLRSDCAGTGRCGKCIVDVSPAGGSGAGSRRLACQTSVHQDIELSIPAATRYAAPAVTKKIDTAMLQALCETQQMPVTALGSGYGFAVDLGTTTVGIYLCEMASSRVLAGDAFQNPQIIYGLDVISRISAVGRDHRTLGVLQRLIVKAIETSALSLLQVAGLGLDQVQTIEVVGNPTMIHLLFRDDPASIGRYPYEPVTSGERRVPAARLGFNLGDTLVVRCPPCLSGFVGADILAAAAAVDMIRQPAGTLLLDMGTNGEMMLRTGTGLLATSCATGPAFEGTNISCGMPAMHGAIHEIRLIEHGRSVRVSMIADDGTTAVPEGICGSGLISAVAGLLEEKIVLANGAFDTSLTLPALRKRARPVEFVIVPEDAARQRDALVISQMDIRAVQLAKAALSTGIGMLCHKSGLERPTKILVAGSFGHHVAPHDCLSIGLFGHFDDVSAIEVMGNLAGTGAIMLLTGRLSKERLREVMDLTSVLQGSDWPEFQDHFIGSMAF